MDDMNTFLTLTPRDEFGLAADAFRLPHNSSRYERPVALLDDGPSRETTPQAPEDEGTPVDLLENHHRIRLSFDQQTKVKGRVTFGSDPELCDVLLTSRRGQYRVSGQHFCITFDAEKRPVIKDTSTNGLIVSYSRQAEHELRRHFQWIIFPDFDTITVKMWKKNGLEFDVHLPRHHKTHVREYQENATRYTADAPPEHLVALNNLAFHSTETSLAASEDLPSDKRPLYLRLSILGTGAFGRVWRVVNASTGAEYAKKEFFRPRGWEKEIEIMKELVHDHIVQLIDYATNPEPLLVMEYLPLGNLEAGHKVSPLSDTDTVSVLKQCLEGLVCLHGQSITHRDLKPENILVFSRTPIHVKLADFGLAQNRLDLKTFCGSPMYAAPEIFLGGHYTNRVDIWSLAVIAVQYGYNLPLSESPENPAGKDTDLYEAPNNAKGKERDLRLWGQSWCSKLIMYVDDWDSDPLIDFLGDHMVKWEPQERQCAARCLEIASEIGLFHEMSPQLGNVTPRLQSHGGLEDIDPEETSTIRGPLWHDTSASVRSKGGTQRPETSSACSHQSSKHQENYDTRSTKRRRSSIDAEPIGLNQTPPGSECVMPRESLWANIGTSVENEINGMSDSKIDRLTCLDGGTRPL
ncbi:hypothetical protein AYO21_09753 [Fonsecaea monophora]|uniref:Serine/threonine-protein kinase ATG1 n=1 Tax=Fonsecaea monophora TaxID=254056 RepID=A0A177EVI3_9EURO|nr:hypothetical protein AYO21_09753 [Fonsecaea monophora]OAG36035.1 hypothetical protein AYO21_09753 [Fonsecaea monophora]